MNFVAQAGQLYVSIVLSAIAATSALIAWWSYRIARLALAENTRASQGRLFWEMLKEYDSQPFGDALNLLAAWARDQVGSVQSMTKQDELLGEAAAKWARSRRAPANLRLDDARRMVKSWFFRAQALYEAGCLDAAIMRQIACIDGGAIFLRVVRRMALQLDPATLDAARYTRFEQLYHGRLDIFCPPLSTPQQLTAATPSPASPPPTSN